MTCIGLKYRLLVVDDEEYISSIVSEALSSNEDYEIVSFSDPQKALDYLEKNQVDLVLTDLIMGDKNGVDVMEKALTSHPDCIVILMTAFPTVNNAISVLKRGAYDYLIKPFKLETMKNAVKRGLEHQQLTRENLHLKEQLALYKFSEAMSSTSSLDSILNLAADTARSVIGVAAISILVRDRAANVPVQYLLKGKPTGKEGTEFLKGNHKICIEVLEDGEARFEKREIKGKQTKIQSLISHPLISGGKGIGLLNVVHEDKFMPIRQGQLHLLSIISAKIASAIETNRLYEHLQSSYLKAIKALANAIEARDRYTRGHTERVTILADLLATRLNWSEEKRAELKMGCTLHDIGKIGIPDAILNKPGRLTSQEREKIESHTLLGARIIEGIDYLKPALPYVLYHHEKYDGTGYPHHLAGEEIPIEGRVLAAVDTFDAIVSDRPYRKGVPFERAIAELEKFKGIQFDPIIVDVLITVWKEGSIDHLGIYPGQDANKEENNKVLTN